MRARLQGLRRQAGRYFGAVAWLFGIVFQRYRRRALFSFAASAIGVALVGAGMAAVFALVSVLETGGSIGIAGIEVSTGDGTPMAVLAAVAGMMILVGAAAVFAARATAVGVASDLLAYLTASAVATYGGLPPHPLDFRSDRHLRAAVGRLRSGYARRCFLVVRQTFEAPVLLLTFAGGIAALIWLQPAAAAAVSVVILAALPVYYLVNMAAVQATKRFEALGKPASRETRTLTETFAARPHDPEGAVHAAFGSASPVQERLRSFAQRFLATVRADLTSQVTGAVALLGLLAYLGSQVLAGSLSITAAVAFMLVLRFVLAAMRGVFRGFALISRHYPSVYRFHLYAAGQERRRSLPDDVTFRLRLMPGGLRAPDAPRRTWRIGPGAVLGVNAPVSPSRYSVWYFASLLANGGDMEQALAVRDATSVAAIPPPPRAATSLRDHFGFAADASYEGVSREIGPEAAARVRVAGVTSLDSVHEPEAFAALRGAANRALALAAARRSDARVVVAPARFLPDDVGATAGRQLIVARHRIPPQRDIADVHVVAASDSAIAAWGSPAWVRANWPAIRAHVRAYEEELQRTLGDDSDDDESDEDDA